MRIHPDLRRARREFWERVYIEALSLTSGNPERSALYADDALPRWDDRFLEKRTSNDPMDGPPWYTEAVPKGLEP